MTNPCFSYPHSPLIFTSAQPLIPLSCQGHMSAHWMVKRHLTSITVADSFLLSHGATKLDFHPEEFPIHATHPCLLVSSVVPEGLVVTKQLDPRVLCRSGPNLRHVSTSHFLLLLWLLLRGETPLVPKPSPRLHWSPKTLLLWVKTLLLRAKTLLLRGKTPKTLLRYRVVVRLHGWALLGCGVWLWAICSLRLLLLLWHHLLRGVIWLVGLPRVGVPGDQV